MFFGTRASLRVLSRPTRSSHSFASTAGARVTHQPKPALPLDPVLKSLLHDVDISLMSKRKETEVPTSTSARELEALENDVGEIGYYDMDHEDHPLEEPARRREDRKSPAARFGSDGIGTVVLSQELERTVTELIEGTNKTLLHSDAKRLFAQEDGSGENWSTAYDVRYKNRRQRYQHSARDGTAFASVILPAHYAAIYAVLRHVKHRLGASWNVDRVIDWGAATGSGLWAALNVFQKSPAPPGEGPLLANSTVVTYLGLDQREGLVSIAKQLLQNTDLGALHLTWRKTFNEEYRINPIDGHSMIALSAFMLSAQLSPFSRKNMVKEMWDSGAQTIILVDHNSPAGFQYITEARHLLLDLGRKDIEDPRTMEHPFRGCHVVAPCPHDRPCPLQHSGPSGLACGFSQRLQRPTFVRRTKHSTQGHEDIGYSYVVVRRGPRPENSTLNAGGRLVGRIGGVEREALEQAKSRTGVLRELQRTQEHGAPQSPSFPASAAASVSAHFHSPLFTDVKSVPSVHVPIDGDVGAVKVHGQQASLSPMLPRVDVHPLDEVAVQAHARVPSLPASVSTPSVPVAMPASTPEFPVSVRDPGAEPRPGGSLEELESPSNLEEVLRSEAYRWPRVVFPPLKKSGHIIIDACTHEGKIMRLTIPKSQGKQPFYDARKSSWGDIFPHAPKNKPIERFQATETTKQRTVLGVKGSDVGKRSKGRDKIDKMHKISYAALDDALQRKQKARWKASRRDLALERDEALRL